MIITYLFAVPILLAHLYFRCHLILRLKLQPLDVGIISAFNRHHRQRQLEHALNVIELGQPPYKVIQLTAMKWVRSAWTSLDTSVFANCWRHTTLLDIESPVIEAATAELMDTEAREINELTALFTTLPIENSMSIANFLNPIEEKATDRFFTDQELITLSQYNPDDDDDQEEAEEVSAVPIAEVFSKADQVKFITVVTAILEDRLPGDSFTLETDSARPQNFGKRRKHGRNRL